MSAIRHILVSFYGFYIMDHGKVDATTKKGIKELKKRLEKEKIPDSQLDKTIKIATWNIRNFAGNRKSISIHYVAEILSRFEIIAITELTENTKDLERVMKILGPYWKVIYSDVNMDQKGNSERIGYLYDGRVIEFTGLAAEADPIREYDEEKDEWLPTLTWWRSPYLVSFKAGMFDFILLAVHLRWGEKTKTEAEKKEERREALDKLADWIEERRNSLHVKDKDIIVLGDFNIPKINDSLYNTITKHGLKTHKKILGDHGTSLKKDKRYDQILYCEENAHQIEGGGAVDFYHNSFLPLYPKSKYPTMTKCKFTYQISDHLPLWIQLNIESE